MRYALITAAAALLLAAPAAAEDWDFILINDSGKVIKLVEISATGAGDWHKNKIGEDEKERDLKVSARMTVHFEKGENNCRYDVRATFADDTNAVWTGINVCDNAFVTLRYRDGAPVFAAN